MQIVRREPAGRWGEAFPLGNGQIGAMVFGQKSEQIPGKIYCERINLTENTFYSGEPPRAANHPQASEAFQRMREEDKKGRYDEVHREAQNFIGRRENYGSHLPTGDLYIVYQDGDITADGPGFEDREARKGRVGREDKEARKDREVREDKKDRYERGLDISEGRAWVYRADSGNRILEEVRVSHPDKVLLIRIQSDRRLNIKIRFEPYNGEGGVRCESEGSSREGSGAKGLHFWADAFETMHCEKKAGVHLEGALTAKTDGSIRCENNELVLSDSSRIEIYVAMETDFGQNSSDISDAVLYQKAWQRCKLAGERGIASVIQRHREDMKRLTSGTELELNGTDTLSEKLPFLFQYGRYLLFCSSREDSVLPAHLQGIWNDNVACRIGWTCDMHLDINTQMNYWPAEFSGLGESTKPLFRWIKERLVPEGRKTARISYGLPGWVGELVSNAWGYAAPYWADSIAPCPTGGLWILTHMWEHYLYTEDVEFLREEAFPLIEEAVAFFEGYVYKNAKGQFICGPSISPENSFLYEGIPLQISSGCTYEILMIRELFTIYMRAYEILKADDRKRYEHIKEITANLLPYRILENGCIAEWDHGLPEADPQHRHTSHLLGLFPFAQITPEETPKLCRAAENTIQRKLTPPQNWEDTGWARSMLMLYEARLQNGDNAYAHIQNMAKNLLEPNGMVYHPPTRGAGAFDHVYELDGNTGLTSCIAEMLIQSHNGRIRLLPALPKEWRAGRIFRFHARGGVEIDLEWQDLELKKAVLASGKPCEVKLLWKGKSCTVHIKRTGKITVTQKDFKDRHDSSG